MSNPAGANSPFRVDVIFNTLRELQQEKERLQHYHNEEKSRCDSLEKKLEACQAKYLQCSDKNTKMIETVNAARQKVLQTQIQANRLRELNDEKRAKITELHNYIEEEVKNEDKERQIFETQLAELTDKFRNAKNYYTKENMTKEMEGWHRQAKETKTEACSKESLLQELTSKFHQIQLETNNLKDSMKTKLEFGITVEELQSAVMVFDKMDKETKEELDKANKQLEEQLEKLEQAKEEYNRKEPTPLATEVNPDGVSG